MKDIDREMWKTIGLMVLTAVVFSGLWVVIVATALHFFL